MKPSGSQLDRWEFEAKGLVGGTNRHDEQAIRQGSFGVVHRKALCLAYAAGADQELGACREWIEANLRGQLLPAFKIVNDLLAARRPKLLSLKEEALTVLDDLDSQLDAAHYNALRRAIEALPD